jgi:hypothetical protein
MGLLSLVKKKSNFVTRLFHNFNQINKGWKVINICEEMAGVFTCLLFISTCIKWYSTWFSLWEIMSFATCPMQQKSVL